jgi:hypothetical protein
VNSHEYPVKHGPKSPPVRYSPRHSAAQSVPAVALECGGAHFIECRPGARARSVRGAITLKLGERAHQYPRVQGFGGSIMGILKVPASTCSP